MTAHRSILSGACALALLAGAALAHHPDDAAHNEARTAAIPTARIWTNTRSGEVVRAAFLSARDGDVRLQSESGALVSIPLADLAPADQAEARQRIAAVLTINEQPAHASPAIAAAPRPAQAASFDLFAPFVKTRWDDRWLFIESDGLPHAPVSHQMMVGITAWQQQVPLPQAYTGDNAWRFPLKPEFAEVPVSAKKQLFRGAIAIAANGIPIFNPIKNDGRTDTFLAGELDEFGGHCGRADDYHYHIAPLALQKVLGKDKPVAYALDGFPIYGYFDPAAKPGEDNACPLRGTEKLDALNGHLGTPTKADGPGPSTVSEPGQYHYHASAAYPYLNGGLRGKVTVKDDQIDPQPRATPVREAGTPLRGASITGFKTLAEKSWSLEYTLGGKKHIWNYRIEGAGKNAKYIFEFVDPDGSKKSQTFTARAGGGGAGGDRPRGDGGSGGRGEGRRPRDQGDRSRPDPASPAPSKPDSAKADPGAFSLSSADVTDGRLAIDCTCDGKSRAPTLSWSAPPEGTKSLAVVMHHIPPDGDTHVYMVLANIPAATRELKTSERGVGAWGQNTVNRRNEYAPPCSQGPGDKSYTITLYALSAPAQITGPLTRDALLAAIKDTTLASETLPVKYARSNSGRDDAQPSGPEGRGRGRRGGRDDAPAQPAGDRPSLLARMTEFKTDVPAHPLDFVLVRPTRNSITLSVVCYEKDACEGYVEYRRDDSAHLDRCASQPLPTGQTVLFALDHLTPDTAYVYRFKHRRVPDKSTPGVKAEPGAEAGAFSSSDYFSFHTPRAPGDAFTFTIQADSHLDANVTPEVYLQTLANALADKPDFHIDLGDTFMTDKRGREYKETLPQYLAQRYYFGQLCHSVPLFMVLGNHDGEVGYASGGPDSMAAWSFAQRTKYFPAPEIIGNASSGNMYTGRTSYASGQGANYYEFTWGSAQCIVLDPFWFTSTRPRGGSGGGGGGGGGGGPGRDKKDADVAPTDENWARTLGKEQYDWLSRTLESSKAKHKFVFIHHLVGGVGKANRGGAEASLFFEWGGQNADGSAGFATHRPGWAMPIHDLLARHHVAAVFHGHDHLYVHSQRDGVAYQCVPQPGNLDGGTRSAPEYGYKSGTIFGSPGHVRVRVAPDTATVEFVRAALPSGHAPDSRGPDANRSIIDRYTLAPQPSR